MRMTRPGGPDHAAMIMAPRLAGRSPGGLVLRVLAAAALALVAYAHADLASIYDGVRAA